MNSHSRISTVIRNADDTTSPVTLERTPDGWLGVVEERAPKPERTTCRNGHPIEFTAWDVAGHARCRLCVAARTARGKQKTNT